MKSGSRPDNRHQESDLFDVVLGDSDSRRYGSRRTTHFLAWGVALGAHLILFVLASRTEPSLESWAAGMAAVIHADLAGQAPIAIDMDSPPLAVEEPPVPPETGPVDDPSLEALVVEDAPLEPATIDPPPSPAPSRQPSPEPAVAPAPGPPQAEATPAEAQPAQAGQVLTADPETAVPVDLTDNTFVSGTANAYVGGATTSTGTGQTAPPLLALGSGGEAVTGSASVAGPPEAPSNGRSRRSGRSRARSVQLQGGEWNCDWPAAALAQDIYEQAVVVRVVVDADGDVVDASVAEDPGYGFADAAIACARERRFTPARNDDGESVRATSPPIRVRFTR